MLKHFQGQFLIKHETGQSMVEFALVIGMLLIFTFGLIDFSRAAYTASVIQAVAQEGARTGIGQLGYGQSLDTAAIETDARSKAVGLDASTVQVDPSQPDDETVQVVVTYPFSFVTPLNALVEVVLRSTLGTSTWDMQSTATMLVQ
ncbi:MAG: pilus assembly protein [Chloroflexi bacterium]|nr:pilus assembly protein [Chloroflexota bacterium]